MFFPIGDDNSQRKQTPYINYILIAINLFVFFYYQQFGANELFTLGYSTVPAEILTGKDIVGHGLAVTPIPVYLTLVTSMFMHGSLSHLIGNMLFLWIFGDNLEDRMGHKRYLYFYLVTGIIASLCHVLTSAISGSNLLIPSLGASGAISAVMAGYLVLFPQNKIRVLIFYFVRSFSAILVIGLWFVFQIVSSLNDTNNGQGGVAYAAHIGGFIAGYILIRFFASKSSKMLADAERRRKFYS